MDTHFEMKHHLKDLPLQERKEFLWSKGYDIKQANVYLDFLFGKEKPNDSTPS